MGKTLNAKCLGDNRTKTAEVNLKDKKAEFLPRQPMDFFSRKLRHGCSFYFTKKLGGGPSFED